MNTKKIFESDTDLKIVTVRHMLEEAGIESFVINKKDSSYAGILGGLTEVYVDETLAEEAISLINENNLSD